MKSSYHRFFEQITKKSQKILLLTHVFPDIDAMGSVLALASRLDNFGKKVEIVADKKSLDTYSFLPMVNRVQEAVVDERIDTIITLDAGSIDRVFAYEYINKKISKQVLINIDHHKDNSNYGDINIVESEISSTGELLALMFEAFNWDIGQSEATCLYAAIASDTGGFRYSNVSADTFRIVSDLLQKGAKHYDVSLNLFESKSLEFLNIIKEALDNLQVDTNVGLIYTTISSDKGDFGREVIDFIRMIDGIEVFGVFRVRDGKVKVSLRSKKYFDVANFANKYNGGGHARAAGITIEGELEQVKIDVVNALKNELTK